MFRRYIDKKFTGKTLQVIEQANEIIEEYGAQGYSLTLRQLYYQFVARDIIANKQSEYKRLGSIINDARLAGDISWTAIEDRTRNVRRIATWDSPAHRLESCASSFRLDFWKEQPCHVEVWIEKDALVGVIERICNRWRVPFFACRGYVSQSEMHDAALRFSNVLTEEDGFGQNGEREVHILHLGDHDPSGIDMTRDIRDRLELFHGGLVGGYLEENFHVHRLALNMSQIEQYTPPPNPAKLTDSRAQDYVARFGRSSWELDALEPSVISALIDDKVKELVDPDIWEDTDRREDEGIALLKETAKQMKGK